MEMKRAIHQFLTDFQESSAFKDYKYQQKRIKKVPGMAERINEYRAKRFLRNQRRAKIKFSPYRQAIAL